MVRRSLTLLLFGVIAICSPPPASAAGFDLALELVAGNFQRVSTVAAPDDASGRLFVVEREGLIRIVTAAGTVLGQPFLDVSGLVDASDIEQGLLAMAFHPQYADNRHFFIAFTDASGDAVIVRYSTSPIDPNQTNTLSAREILRLPQPSALHNIHELAFGDDGFLYVGSGDGGPAGDPGGEGQALDTLLGKILRLDVDPTRFPDGGYGIPADNPFVGNPSALDEIWAYGLRNPANFSFDLASSGLFIADVGQDLWEEVNYEPLNSIGGRNYGWSVMEGSQCFDPPDGCDTSGLTLPIAEYPQDVNEDCAVIGGHVYGGTRFPWLTGWYLFGDFCSGKVRGLRQGCDGWRMEILLDLPFRISALGRDPNGEVYVAEWSTRNAGRLFRIMATPGADMFKDGFESGNLVSWSTCID